MNIAFCDGMLLQNEDWENPWFQPWDDRPTIRIFLGKLIQL